MEVINVWLLMLVILFSVANLVIEINDNITTQFELFYRLLFGSIAVGALTCILYNKVVWFYSFGILVILIVRFMNKKDSFNHN